MSYAFPVSDEEYAYMTAYAERFQQTPEALFREWIEDFIEIEETQKVMFEREKEREASGEFANDRFFLLAGSLSKLVPGLDDVPNGSIIQGE